MIYHSEINRGLFPGDGGVFPTEGILFPSDSGLDLVIYEKTETGTAQEKEKKCFEKVTVK